MNQHVCRCCLLENPVPSHNIFDEASTLRLDLQHCAPNVNFVPEDGLPDVICELCRLRIRAALDFRYRCEESDRELRKRYEDENMAIEEVLCLGGILTQIDREVNGSSLEEIGNSQETVKIAEILSEDAENLVDLEPLDSMLNELLLDSYSCFSNIPEPGQSVRNDDEEHTMTELLNSVLNDATFESTTDSLLASDINEQTISPQSSTPIAETFNVHNQCLTDTMTLPISSKVISKDSIPMSALQNHEVIGNTLQTTSVYTEIIKTFVEPYNDKTLVEPKVTNKKSFTTPKSLHPCPECEKKFTRNFQLKLHLISVHNIGDGLQYTCDECQMTFASRHSLSYHHKKIHSEERPFACTDCSRRFILRTQLASHMRIHTGNAKPRIFECPSAGCDKTWPTKSDLRTHMRTHDANVERKWSCDRCEKSFYTRGHLNSHILVHTGQKPFACALCEKSYQSVGNLNNHMFQHHRHLLLAKQEI